MPTNRAELYVLSLLGGVRANWVMARSWPSSFEYMMAEVPIVLESGTGRGSG